MEKILHDLGITIKLPAVSIPTINVPDGTWIVVAVFILGIIVGVAAIRHARTRLAGLHLHHKLKNDRVKAIHGNADTNAVFVVHDSGETEIPLKPYRSGKLPARGFEGFTPREIARGAARIGRRAYVRRSFHKTKDNGPDHWRVEPMPESPLLKEEPTRPHKSDRSKQAPTASASDGRKQDERPDRGQRPNQAPVPEQQPASTAIN